MNDFLFLFSPINSNDIVKYFQYFNIIYMIFYNTLMSFNAFLVLACYFILYSRVDPRVSTIINQYNVGMCLSSILTKTSTFFLFLLRSQNILILQLFFIYTWAKFNDLKRFWCVRYKTLDHPSIQTRRSIGFISYPFFLSYSYVITKFKNDV